MTKAASPRKKAASEERKILMQAVAVIEDVMQGRRPLQGEVAELRRRVERLEELLKEANKTTHERNLTIGELRKAKGKNHG